MERNHRIQPSRSLLVPKGIGSSDNSSTSTEDVSLPVRASYNKTALHISLGNNRGLYLETPVLLEGETLKAAVEQATKAYWDKQYRIDGSGRLKNKRFRVTTKKKANQTAKNIKTRRQFNCNKIIANHRNPTQSNILLKIQISKCAALPILSNIDVDQCSATTGRNATDDPVSTFNGKKPEQLTSPVLSADAEISNERISKIMEWELSYENAAIISAGVSLLNEVVAKFTELMLSDMNKTDVADDVSKLTKVSATPTDNGSHEYVTTKKVLTDIKSIRENVAKSLATSSLAQSKPNNTPTASAECKCTGRGSLSRTNGTTSARVLSDIKLLREMLAKSLKGDFSMSDKRTERSNDTDHHDQVSPQDIAVEKHAGDEVDNSNIADEIAVEEQARDEVDNSNIADKTSTIFINAVDDDPFGIMSIYKSSRLHDETCSKVSNENTEKTDFGYKYFRPF